MTKSIDSLTRDMARMDLKDKLLDEMARMDQTEAAVCESRAKNTFKSRSRYYSPVCGSDRNQLCAKYNKNPGHDPITGAPLDTKARSFFDSMCKFDTQAELCSQSENEGDPKRYAYLKQLCRTPNVCHEWWSSGKDPFTKKTTKYKALIDAYCGMEPRIYTCPCKRVRLLRQTLSTCWHDASSMALILPMETRIIFLPYFIRKHAGFNAICKQNRTADDRRPKLFTTITDDGKLKKAAKIKPSKLMTDFNMREKVINRLELKHDKVRGGHVVPFFEKVVKDVFPPSAGNFAAEYTLRDPNYPIFYRTMRRANDYFGIKVIPDRIMTDQKLLIVVIENEEKVNCFYQVLPIYKVNHHTYSLTARVYSYLDIHARADVKCGSKWFTYDNELLEKLKYLTSANTTSATKAMQYYSNDLLQIFVYVRDDHLRF